MKQSPFKRWLLIEKIISFKRRLLWAVALAMTRKSNQVMLGKNGKTQNQSRVVPDTVLSVALLIGDSYANQNSYHGRSWT